MQSQVSCCRCLLYLGDLARYEQLYSVLGGQARDWSTAAKYYRQAAAMWPSGGNPHNQLAVLATYVRDELLAVYYYIRSLSVENPFVTAKENLRLLFEKNQQRFEQSPGLTDLLGKAERFSGNNSGCVQWADINLPEIIQGQQTNSELVQLLGGIDELQKQFQHCYVRLIGIVFTQTSFDEVHKLLLVALCLLQQLLSQSAIGGYAGIRKDSLASSELVPLRELDILRMIAVLIFSIHHAHIGVGHGLASSSDLVQMSDPLNYALRISLNFVSFLCLLRSYTESTLHSVLPAITVFLVWFASQRDLLLRIRADKYLQEVVSVLLQQADKSITILTDLKYNTEQTNEVSQMKVGAEKAEIGVPDHLTLPLWEDQELHGFSPLHFVHNKLTFSNEMLPVELNEAKAFAIRFLRLGSALKEIKDNLIGKPSHNSDAVMNATLPEINAELIPGVSRVAAVSPNEALSLEEWAKQGVNCLLPIVENQANAPGSGCTSAKVYTPPEERTAACTDMILGQKRSLSWLASNSISPPKSKRLCSFMRHPSLSTCATLPDKLSCKSPLPPLPPSLLTEIRSSASRSFQEQYIVKEILQENVYEQAEDYLRKEICSVHRHQITTGLKNAESGSKGGVQGAFLAVSGTHGNSMSLSMVTAEQTTELVHSNQLSSSVDREEARHLPTCKRTPDGRNHVSEILEKVPQDLNWLDTYTHVKPASVSCILRASNLDLCSSELDSLSTRHTIEMAKFWSIRTPFHTQPLSTQNPFVTMQNNKISSNLHLPRHVSTSIGSFVRLW
ncbi:hypothetical protein O6H91_12G042000 [Diphasiastrum complanatum]|nr:hypothetical protein O6H91_12G042000 [Diphasiastrum complanatum]